MLPIVTWKWGQLFGAEYVNRLRSMVERHLHMPHRLVCVTDDTTGIDAKVECLPIDYTGISGARCSRRLPQYSADFPVGPRFLSIDLDVVIVNDITPLVDRPEPLVCWRVGYARKYAGGMILMNRGVLDGFWREYSAKPYDFSAGSKALKGAARDGSDQDMLNWYMLKHKIEPACWRDEDGLVSPFGKARCALRPRKVGGKWTFPEFNAVTAVPTLPEGARMVFVGWQDKAVLDNGLLPWVRENWR